MKKITFSIEWNEEKAAALKMFLEQKHICLEDKIIEFLDGLYIKTVPSAVRNYVDLKSAAPQKAPAKIQNITPKNDENTTETV